MIFPKLLVVQLTLSINPDFITLHISGGSEMMDAANRSIRKQA